MYFECENSNCDKDKDQVFYADFFPAFCPFCGEKLFERLLRSWPNSRRALTKEERDNIFDN